MSAPWIRVHPEKRHDVAAALVAGAVAVGAGLAAFWLARVLLAREPLPGGEAAPPSKHGGEAGGSRG